MRIGELSRRTGVHTHQLRYYETQGLLEADRRANGYREYDENAVLRVRQIRHLLGAGLSSEDIAYLLPCAVGEAPELIGCPELLAAMRSRLSGETVSAWSNSQRVPAGKSPSAASRSNTARSRRMVSS